MIGNRTPGLLVIMIAVGIIVTGILLSVFYAQYQWLAGQIVDVSSSEYTRLAEANFERNARLRLENAADRMKLAAATQRNSDIYVALNAALIENDTLTGIVYTNPAGDVYRAGSYPPTPPSAQSTWLAERLLITYSIEVDGVRQGTLSGAFDLSGLYAESAKFTDEITATELRSRSISFLWAGTGTLGALLLIGGVAWFIIRDRHQCRYDCPKCIERLYN